MPSFATLVDRRGGKRLIRLLALLLALAVSTPVLLADDGDHDQDHRDHGRFVDPIVGCWIVHVTINTITPTPNPPPHLPFKIDNVAALGADGNTANFFPSLGGSSGNQAYGPWEKVAPRTYRQHIVAVNADGNGFATTFTGPLVLNAQGDHISGPFVTRIIDKNGQLIQQWIGTLLFDRITLSSTSPP